VHWSKQYFLPRIWSSPTWNHWASRLAESKVTQIWVTLAVSAISNYTKIRKQTSTRCGQATAFLNRNIARRESNSSRTLSQLVTFKAHAKLHARILLNVYESPAVVRSLRAHVIGTWLAFSSNRESRVLRWEKGCVVVRFFSLNTGSERNFTLFHMGHKRLLSEINHSQVPLSSRNLSGR
jgi:hypothetical protein